MAANGESKNSGEEARLAEQNKYISAGLGFSIHPAIEKAIGDRDGSIRIASISQGAQGQTSGLESAKWEVIEAKDLTSPSGIDSQHQQAFDIVAVRLLHAQMTGEEWDLAMKNLISLVRPGGWIQWIDWDPITVRVAGAKPGTSDQALRQLLQRYTDLLKANKVGTTYKIPNGFQAAGLEDGDSDIYALTPDAEFTSNVAKGAYDVLREKRATELEELGELWNRVEEEIRVGGPLLWYDLWCHIARKP